MRLDTRLTCYFPQFIKNMEKTAQPLTVKQIEALLALVSLGLLLG